MNIFWNSKGSTCYKHLKQHVPECRAVKTFLSSRLIIMNSRRLWNSHQGTSSWGPWHLATLWNLESRKWPFLGVFKRYSPPPRMPCCFVRIRARLGTMPSKRLSKCPRLIVWTFHRYLNQLKYAFNVKSKLGNRCFTISFSFTERFRMVTPQDFAEQSVTSKKRI